MQETEVKLIMMSEVPSEKVNWLWYPYIPYVKITIVQGDPGDGKTTFILTVTALLTTGRLMPECDIPIEPITVIYQTAEDGLSDTIKPRLMEAGANCSKVAVIVRELVRTRAVPRAILYRYYKWWKESFYRW